MEEITWSNGTCFEVLFDGTIVRKQGIDMVARKREQERPHVTTSWHVALFGGMNAAPAKRVAMAELRRLIEGLGYGEMRTLLNSGNVVFTTSAGNAGNAASRIKRPWRRNSASPLE